MRMYILWILLLKSQDFATKESNLSTCLFTQSSLGWLWHRRPGHVGMKQLNRLLKHDLVVGLKNVKFEKDKLCSACQAGKQVANAHPTKSVMSTERPLKLLHMDLFGPTTYRSIGGNCYCLVVVDDYSKCHGFSFFMTRPIHMTLSRNSLQGPKMNLSSR